MTTTEQLSADVEAVEADMPVTFSFEGKDYIGQRTPNAAKLEMQDAGFEQTFDFTMEVLLSKFIAPQRAPSHLEVITIAEVDYRIVGVTTDQAGVVNTYTLKDNS